MNLSELRSPCAEPFVCDGNQRIQACNYAPVRQAGPPGDEGWGSDSGEAGGLGGVESITPKGSTVSCFPRSASGDKGHTYLFSGSL